jgi:hypothetical protein
LEWLKLKEIIEPEELCRSECLNSYLLLNIYSMGVFKRRRKGAKLRTG